MTTEIHSSWRQLWRVTSVLSADLKSYLLCHDQSWEKLPPSWQQRYIRHEDYCGDLPQFCNLWSVTSVLIKAEKIWKQKYIYHDNNCEELPQFNYQSWRVTSVMITTVAARQNWGRPARPAICRIWVSLYSCHPDYDKKKSTLIQWTYFKYPKVKFLTDRPDN